MPRLRLALLVAGALALAGCAPVVTLPAAEDAADPGCADVVVSLPAEIGADSLPEPLERRDVSSQGSAAYGEPSAVTLRCGMPEPAPSTERCITVGDVDWLLLGQEDDVWTLVSYGRSPATEVVIDTKVTSSSSALEALSPAVARTELVRTCS